MPDISQCSTGRKIIMKSGSPEGSANSSYISRSKITNRMLYFKGVGRPHFAFGHGEAVSCYKENGSYMPNYFFNSGVSMRAGVGLVFIGNNIYTLGSSKGRKFNKFSKELILDKPMDLGSGNFLGMDTDGEFIYTWRADEGKKIRKWDQNLDLVAIIDIPVPGNRASSRFGMDKDYIYITSADSKPSRAWRNKLTKGGSLVISKKMYEETDNVELVEAYTNLDGSRIVAHQKIYNYSTKIDTAKALTISKDSLEDLYALDSITNGGVGAYYTEYPIVDKKNLYFRGLTLNFGKWNQVNKETYELQKFLELSIFPSRNLWDGIKI